MFGDFSGASAFPKLDSSKSTVASAFISGTQDSAADKKEEKKADVFGGLKLTTPAPD